jgi:hypothetical protein
MKQFLKNLVSSTGEVSAMRVMSLMSVTIAGSLAVIGLYKNSDLVGLATLCGTFLTAAFTGKIMQKNTEMKNK